MRDIKEKIKIILSFIFTYLVLVCVHEFSHIITALLLNQEITKIGFGLASKSFFSFSFFVNINFTNDNFLGLVALGGSFFTIIICLFLMCIGKKTDKKLFYFIPLTYILMEFGYWLLSPVFQLGDGYIFLNAVNMPLFHYYSIIISVLVPFIIISFYYLKETFLMGSLKKDKKGIHQSKEKTNKKTTKGGKYMESIEIDAKDLNTEEEMIVKIMHHYERKNRRTELSVCLFLVFVFVLFAVFMLLMSI